MARIEEILEMNNVAQIKSIIMRQKKSFTTPYEEIKEQYDPRTHKVMDERYRKKKVVKVKTDRIDETTLKPIYREKKIDVCRIPVPIQRILVRRCAGYLFSIPSEYQVKTSGTEAKVADLHQEILNIFEDNKIEYFDKRLARALFSEREVAELWYHVPDASGHPTEELRVHLLSPSQGDELYPHFDDFNRLDALLRKYYTTKADGKVIGHYDLYDRHNVYRWSDDGGEPETLAVGQPHGFTKLPIVYYRIEETIWEQVQHIIERVETLLSNWGDTNDYFGSPSYFIKGSLTGFADKGEQGRVYTGGSESSMQVLSWDSSPNSMNGELANLLNIIFSYTQVGDYSFENMKTLGNNTSGAAIELMFTDPKMNAEMMIELFGEMFTRRYNVVKDGIGALKGYSQSVIDALRIKPKFNTYKPKNSIETMQLINMATGSKQSMSQDTAIEQNPLIFDKDAERNKIKEEQQQQALQDVLGLAQ